MEISGNALALLICILIAFAVFGIDRIRDGKK
jgi:hypothetical protein